MIWILVTIVIYVAFALIVFLKIRSSKGSIIETQKKNLEVAEEDLVKMEEVLKQILSLSLGLIRKEDILALDAMLDDLEASIGAEKGRFAITQAELDSVEIRLRELEELKRELEVSTMDAIREIEMLKAQERDVSNQNEVIKEQIGSANDQIDILLDMFNDDGIVTEQLNGARAQMKQVETNILFYEEEVAKINQQYVVLKKAYDALDIEYAQLYEKRQQELDGKPALTDRPTAADEGEAEAETDSAE
ncbi:MAG TPA: hypothetical protein PKA63_07755 [Oligoflexia bacterium]|nr:hypothetical protein [Oligoflexia bacterium]HMP48544.1 hypothetical protein [Oligoflexia bacterium]